jgi:hypothetical protein
VNTAPTEKDRLITALAGLEADAERSVVQRTRRNVYIAAVDHHEGRTLRRRHVGIAILVAAVLFVLLTPALWSGVDDLLGGEHLTDLPGLVAAFVFTLFAGVAAVLFLLGGRSQEQMRNFRR